MTGKPEQVPGIMQEFVNPDAVDERGGPLFGTDEIVGESHDDHAEDRPGHDLRDRDGNLERYFERGADRAGGLVLGLCNHTFTFQFERAS